MYARLSKAEVAFLIYVLPLLTQDVCVCANSVYPSWNVYGNANNPGTSMVMLTFFDGANFSMAGGCEVVPQLPCHHGKLCFCESTVHASAGEDASLIICEKSPAGGWNGCNILLSLTMWKGQQQDYSAVS